MKLKHRFGILYDLSNAQKKKGILYDLSGTKKKEGLNNGFKILKINGKEFSDEILKNTLEEKDNKIEILIVTFFL